MGSRATSSSSSSSTTTLAYLLVQGARAAAARPALAKVALRAVALLGAISVAAALGATAADLADATDALVAAPKEQERARCDGVSNKQVARANVVVVSAVTYEPERAQSEFCEQVPPHSDTHWFLELQSWHEAP